MAGKSAYEIRLELLQLAYKIVETKALSESALDAAENGNELVPMTRKVTTGEVIAEAEKLNEFVSTKAG